MTDHEVACDGPCTHSVFDIRAVRRVFGLQRTAAYELTRAPGFPAPIVISARCLRWPVAGTLRYRDSLREDAAPTARDAVMATANDGHAYPGVCRLDVASAGDIAGLLRTHRRTVYRLAEEPGFPAPFVLSARCLRWPMVDVLWFVDALAGGPDAGEGAR